jgi:hypothetical protein
MYKIPQEYKLIFLVGEEKKKREREGENVM